MDYSESPVTRGYKRFFDVYRVDIDRIPQFDQFVVALKEALISCQDAALSGRPRGLNDNASQVRAEREKLGMSLKSLARKAGVSVLTLRGLERGKVKPHKATLTKIMEALRGPGK